MTNTRPHKRWGIAWTLLVAAFALHVADEALNDFLPLYNSVAESVRSSSPGFPMPVFTFEGWLTMLGVALVVLLVLTPLVFSGTRGMRVPAWIFSVVMILNALGHMTMSVFAGYFVPGVYSSPPLLAAAIFLFVETRRQARRAG